MSETSDNKLSKVRHTFRPHTVMESFIKLFVIALSWWHRAIDFTPGLDREKMLPENHWVVAGFAQSVLLNMTVFYGFNMWAETYDFTRALLAFFFGGAFFLLLLIMVMQVSTHSDKPEYASVPALAFIPLFSIIAIAITAVFGDVHLLMIPFLLLVSFWFSGPVNEMFKEQRLARRSIWHWYWKLVTEGREFK